ncbi:transcriptional regulator [Streptomyces sp. Ru73]|uniref:MarR family transcriptional regulator n=1 Tax=Streptomyces sp. Ru73 TaxID=2080748 RepID=UPI000CDD1DB2|nr:MarR family transcriptional regulator [Streptomyces sp. Ru73]POX39350.1 transcriptional regulator [Streptomyces sp. Ru73]
MSEDAGRGHDDVDAVTGAVLSASRVLVAVSARSLAAIEGTVTLPQFRLLVVLAEHRAAKLVTVAELLGVNPSTALRMIDRLIAAGFVVREVNPRSRRETILQLTDEGRRIVADVTERRHAEVAAIVARMPAAQRGELVTALSAFATAAGEPLAPAPAADPSVPGRPDPGTA